jgi:hypothetical protein
VVASWFVTVNLLVQAQISSAKSNSIGAILLIATRLQAAMCVPQPRGSKFELEILTEMVERIFTTYWAAWFTSVMSWVLLRGCATHQLGRARLDA